MDLELQSSVFQPMIPKELLDLDKAKEEDRLKIKKRDNKKKLESVTAEVIKVYQEMLDEKIAVSSKFQQLQNEKVAKKLELEEIKTKNLILDQEKKFLQNKIERLNMQQNGKEEIEDLAIQVHKLKDEINSKKCSYIKSNLELMKGISFYKQYLQCNVFESDGLVVISLDPSAQNMSQAQAYVRFKVEEECKTFQIVDYEPKVPNMEKLKEKCGETGDFQCFIRSFREEVFKLKKGERSSNNKENTNVNNKKKTDI